jgi:hypothetical protein
METDMSLPTGRDTQSGGVGLFSGCARILGQRRRQLETHNNRRLLFMASRPGANQALVDENYWFENDFLSFLNSAAFALRRPARTKTVSNGRRNERRAPAS